MLALLALVLTSLIGYNQQQMQRRAYHGMIRDELEVAATGTAQNVMELVAARAFDEASVPATMRAGGLLDVPRSPALFVTASAFGATDRGAAGCDLRDPNVTPQCDDVDDVDGVTDRVNVDLGDNRLLPFDALLDVVYVTGPADDSPVALVPTLHKRVTLSMTSPLIYQGERPLVTISRVISYDPVKAEYDYEQIYGAFGAAIEIVPTDT
jgi:hypothetical protein